MQAQSKLQKLPKIYSLRWLQQHNRALVMLDIVIYIQNYRCSWWVHCLSQKLEKWIQTSLPNPTFYTNYVELKSQSNVYFISKRLNMLHLCSVEYRTVLLCRGHSIIHTCCITTAKVVSSTPNTRDVTSTCH
jgi:hypothetical protein